MSHENFVFQVGSGDLYGEEEEEDDYNEPITTTTSTPHPHRHHHGETFQILNETNLSPSEVQYQLPSTSLLINYDELIATPVFVSSFSLNHSNYCNND